MKSKFTQSRTKTRTRPLKLTWHQSWVLNKTYWPSYWPHLSALACTKDRWYNLLVFMLYIYFPIEFPQDLDWRLRLLPVYVSNWSLFPDIKTLSSSQPQLAGCFIFLEPFSVNPRGGCNVMKIPVDLQFVKYQFAWHQHPCCLQSPFIPVGVKQNPWKSILQYRVLINSSE